MGDRASGDRMSVDPLTTSGGAVVGDAIARLVHALSPPDESERHAAANALIELYVDLIAENETLQWEIDFALEHRPLTRQARRKTRPAVRQEPAAAEPCHLRRRPQSRTRPLILPVARYLKGKSRLCIPGFPQHQEALDGF